MAKSFKECLIEQLNAITNKDNNINSVIAWLESSIETTEIKVFSTSASFNNVAVPENLLTEVENANNNYCLLFESETVAEGIDSLHIFDYGWSSFSCFNNRTGEYEFQNESNINYVKNLFGSYLYFNRYLKKQTTTYINNYMSFYSATQSNRTGINRMGWYKKFTNATMTPSVLWIPGILSTANTTQITSHPFTTSFTLQSGIFSDSTLETEINLNWYKSIFAEYQQNNAFAYTVGGTYGVYNEIIDIITEEDLNYVMAIYGIPYYTTSRTIAQTGTFEDFIAPELPIEILPTEPGQDENTTNTQGGQGNFQSDSITYPHNAIVGTGVGITTYLLTTQQLLYVLNKIWVPDLIDVFTGFDLSPIVNALIWPCDMMTGRNVSDSPVEIATPGVYIGKNHLDFITLEGEDETAYFINPLYINVKDFGALNLKSEGFYGGFLDYEPYTQMQLYLPYYGFTAISCHDVINHEVRINLCLDVSTGAGKYLILIDGVVKYTFECQIGVQIQLTNNNFTSTLNAFMRNATTSIIQPETAPLTLTGAIGNLADLALNADVSTIGATGNNNERLNCQYPYLIIERMETAVPNDYNKNYGRPSMITTQLKELKGFTTVPNVLIETTATETEKKEIISLLNEGVIIK